MAMVLLIFSRRLGTLSGFLFGSDLGAISDERGDYATVGSYRLIVHQW